MDKHIMYPKVPPVGYDTLVGVPILSELHAVIRGNHGWYYPFTIIIVSNIKK